MSSESKLTRLTVVGQPADLPSDLTAGQVAAAVAKGWSVSFIGPDGGERFVNPRFVLFWFEQDVESV